HQKAGCPAQATETGRYALAPVAAGTFPPTHDGGQQPVAERAAHPEDLSASHFLLPPCVFLLGSPTFGLLAGVGRSSRRRREQLSIVWPPADAAVDGELVRGSRDSRTRRTIPCGTRSFYPSGGVGVNTIL